MWPAWRLILAGVTSPEALRTTWTLVDLADANEALDVKQEAERQAHQRAQQK